MDCNLNFKPHVTHILGKIAKHAGILFKIRHNLTTEAKITYYNSLVLPCLNFNILHWGGTNKAHLVPLVNMQKRIIRTIAGASFTAHTTPLFYRYKLLKLEDVYRFQAIVDTHAKILLKGEYRSLHARNTRFSNLAVPKFHRTQRTQQSITFQGPSMWNTLPEHLQQIDSMKVFKDNLKSYFIELYNDH